MNSNVIRVFIFATGAIIGSVVTYIFCKKAEKDKLDAIMESYEEEIREMLNSVTVDDIPTETVKAEEDPVKFKYTEQNDYTKYYKHNSGPTLYNQEYEQLVEDESYSGGTENGPVVVGMNVYLQNEEGYTQQEMLYYIDDDYLCYSDNIGEAIDIKDHMVGDENLELFTLTDCDTIWVRNDYYKEYYEIEKLYGPCPINDDI